MGRKSALLFCGLLTVRVFSAGPPSSLGRPDGNTYHVARNNPTADDANPGTLERPWRSIGKAASTVLPGDTVMVHDGVYREQVSLSRSGRPDAPITFQATNGKVTVTGSDPISGWVRHAGHVYRTTVEWWAPEGWMKCTGKAGNWNGVGGRDTDEVFENGEPLDEASTVPGKPGQFHYDHDEKALFVWCSDSTSPAGKTIEAIRRGGCLVVSASHVRVLGFEFRNAALRIVYVKGGDHNVIEDNVLRYSAANTGIHLARGADHNLFRGNRVSHIGYAGVEISRNSNHNTIEDNEISYCCSEGIIIQSGHVGGIGHRFVGNRIHHVFREDGIDLKCGHDLLVKGNTIYECSNLGVQAFNHHGNPDIKFKYHRHNKALIEDNLIYANGGGGIYVFEGEYEIRNNIIFGNGQAEPYGDSWGGREHKKPGGFAIEIGPCFKIDGRVLQQRIINNTCYANARGEIWVGGPWEADPLHCLVRNNILVGGTQGVLLKVNRAGAAGLDADFNVLRIGPGGAFAEWGCVRDGNTSSETSSRAYVGTKVLTFDQYRDTTGLGAHSLSADPGLVDPERGDFRLRPDSPCRRAGAVVPGTVSTVKPDIGATPVTHPLPLP